MEVAQACDYVIELPTTRIAAIDFTATPDARIAIDGLAIIAAIIVVIAMAIGMVARIMRVALALMLDRHLIQHIDMGVSRLREWGGRRNISRLRWCRDSKRHSGRGDKGEFLSSLNSHSSNSCSHQVLALAGADESTAIRCVQV